VKKNYDTIIIGGGFYGLRIAQFLKEELDQKNVLVIEKETEVMQRASYNNQARVHGGYHYPRSVLTALRSQVNLPIFIKEYEETVKNNFEKYYGVAKSFSKVTAKQYQKFFERIGAKLTSSEEVKSYFDPKLIDDVFKVEEFVFDAVKLKKTLTSKLKKLGVLIVTNVVVDTVKKENDRLQVNTTTDIYYAKYVLNTTYSSINTVNKKSELPIIPLKHELTEMCIVNLPKELKEKAITVMCGPFFSIMPFPALSSHTLSHVRYTPHSEWFDTEENVREPHEYLDSIKKISHFPQMVADVKRFLPKLGEKVEYTGKSLWEIKTVLPQSEGDDSRPILYKEHHGKLNNYICIMGGKIDNVYDVFKELRITYGKKA
jgi:glycine/D-amino acid oxidase-like deaminating enzyme